MLDKKALAWYLAIAFGFSWILFSLPLAFRALDEQTVAAIRLVCWVIAMWGPGIAALITTLFVLKEPISSLGLKRFGKFRYYLAAWFVPPVLVALVIPFSILFGLAEYDPNLTVLQNMAALAPKDSGITVQILLIVQLAQGLLLGPLLNVFATMGEELGWRGFLLPKLLPLGQWKAILLSGVIWGVWHAPAILQGHNYPGHPVAGVFMMILFCVAIGAVMSWLYLATKSTWAPAFGHGAVNAWGGLPLIFLVAGYNPLWGGTIASLTGVIVTALFIGLLVLLKQMPVQPQGS
ncbi:MAG: CPBP family intramembrane glutamic endopeptidase [Anaerolineales bacterium]|jgi:membrane protease YdiL (CAAX protease family)|nr:CPBP family intramembrane glutamic endopeptidase [Anaerolineales bacterium]